MSDSNFNYVEQLALLNQATFDPQATREYDLMAGGFYWTDEFPPAFLAECFRLENCLNRFIVGHRASIILGTPYPHRFPVLWEDIRRICPDWPGLRSERQCRSLAPDLRQADREALKAVEDAFD